MSQDNSATNSKLLELKDKGNSCVKNGNYTEAILHYTHAIKMDQKQHELYSNRSHAFLKVEQYYFALQDALHTIRLRPDWPKGYFRAGEAEFAAQQYKKAVESYRKSLYLEANDYVFTRLQAAQMEYRKIEQSEGQMPWYGAAIGSVCGILLVVGDQIATKSPVINNPVFQAVIIIMVGVVGYLLGSAYRYVLVSQRKSLLDPPPDLFNDGSSSMTSFDGEEDSCRSGEKLDAKKDKHHYKKSTARQRYQKGKS